MEKKTLQSIITFFGLSAIVSFLALIIFQLKVNQDTTEIIQQHSTLTDNKASQWGAIPGERGVEMQHTFIPFTYDRQKDTFIPSGEFNFDLKQEFKNRTYIQNSPGYIKYLPTFWLESMSETPANIEAINMLAAQSIYREFNSPFMIKGPRYLDIIIKAIQSDFLNYYFRHTIFEFYIKDKDLVFATIFKQAKLTPEQQNDIWTDTQYGWQQESTFSAWVIGAYNQEYTQFQERFALDDLQVSILMGAESLIVKMRKLSIYALSDGIKNQMLGNCDVPEQCTTWELATAQWGLGVLTKEQYVPPVIFEKGGYATFNSSIPELCEFYLLSEEVHLQYDDVRKILQENLQADNNLLNFNTMQLIVDNIDNTPLILNKLGFSLDDGKVGLLIDYIKRIQTRITTRNEVLAYESWRSMNRFITLGQELLRTGLYAKALFYQTSNECKKYFEQYPQVCEAQDDTLPFTEYDFTNNIDAALLWIRIIFNGEDSAKLKADIGIENINDFIQTGPLADILTKIKNRFSIYHHCLLLTQCSSQELFLKQWQKGSITLTYPDLGFKETDKVKGLSQWDIYKNTYGDVAFELSYFYQETQFDLFNYDMGGILGYYSLWNLYEHVNNKVALHPEFEFEGQDAIQIAKYVQNAMLLQFGGQFVKSDAKQYLFNYENQYTKEKETWSPLQGGVQWKSTSSQLIRSDSHEYFEFATDDDYFQLDTGIKNIDNVGKVIKTFMDTKIKAKRVLFCDRKTDFITSYYYHTGDQVKGSFGLSFKPQTSQKELALFDLDIYQDVIFKRSSETQLHDFTTAKYKLEDQLIDLEKVEGYPLYISVGAPKMTCYSIEGQDCAAYQKNIKSSEIQIEVNTGITVSLIKNYFYWLKVDKESPLLAGPIKEETFIPIALRKVSYQYNSKQMSSQFQDIYDINVRRTAYLWVFLTLGVIFTGCTIGSVVYYFKKRNELHNPPLSVYSSFADH